MLTQLWGCKHPERPRAQGATCRHAFCPARGSCWHWPPGSVCCRAPGRAPWRWWQEPAVEHRRLPAVHTAPLPSRPPPTPCLTCSRLGSPSAPSFLLHPLGAPGRGCYPACSSLTQRPNMLLPSGSALATSSLLTLFPECFSSFARATCSLSVSGAQYSNCASLGWEVYQPCSHYIPK